ncbi:porin [Microvirga pudoricolor]|uniref:porin n=1 Tax=Microvirga pudoricolor TaxID=2778729 RepID=UPI001950D82F|nr:porin [Microvirga pudoricolor]MBM6595985.1 porin [Microvirga pudoricolor]
MKLVKSLLLGSAAGLAAFAGAQAADLPVKKAAPVEYVRVCSTYGSGFFYIPGTDTCLRVSGRVRADYLFNSPLTRASDAVGFRARGRIQLDARTNTAYGLLRSVVRMEITRDSGTPFGRTGAIGQSPNIDQAFVQFGGLTAGRVESFFSNTDLPTQHMGTLRFDDAPNVNLFAYTFTFGNGFSATVSVEDGLDRRYNDATFDDAAAFAYGGQRIPDVVGNIKYSGTWGTAQLSGALHQLRAATPYTAFGFADYPDTEYGFAVAFAGSVNLPQIAEGDALWFAATYADGALGYLSGGNDVLNTNPNTALGGTGLLGFTDAYVDPLTGDIKRGRGWALAGGFTHYFTPEVRASLFGSYLRVNYSGAANALTATGYNGFVDFNEWRLGGNVFWQPVSGLDIGVEAIYVKLDARNRFVLPTGSAYNDDHAWEGRLRVQRDF